MPPAAAARILQPTGQTARNGQDRSLQTCRRFAFPPIITYPRLFVGRGLDPSLLLCGYCQFPGGVGSPRPRHNGNSNIVGRFVGAAYMPPVAAARILRTIGKNRKFATFPFGLSKNFPLPLTSGLSYAIVCLLVMTNLIQLPPFSISRPARVPPVSGGFMESSVSIC